MMALKCRIKAWKSWKKHYIGLTWTYSVLVFLGIIHSPTFALEQHICGGYFDFNRDNDVTTIRMLNKDKRGNTNIIKGVNDKELWDKVAEYCNNDVIATEAAYEALEDRKRRTVDPMEDDLK